MVSKNVESTHWESPSHQLKLQHGLPEAVTKISVQEAEGVHPQDEGSAAQVPTQQGLVVRRTRMATIAPEFSLQSAPLQGEVFGLGEADGAAE